MWYFFFHLIIYPLYKISFQRPRTMPTTLRLRYQKQTPYKENVFIAVVDEAKPEETPSFQKICDICDTLKEAYPGLYLPTYYKENFSSIRFKNGNGGYPARKFHRDSVYDCEFVIKKKIVADNKVVLNAFLNKAKLVSKADTDEGEELEL